MSPGAGQPVTQQSVADKAQFAPHLPAASLPCPNASSYIRKSGVLLLLVATLGISIRLFHMKDQSGLCGSDFPVFYAGGKLAGTPDLYSKAKVQAIHQQVAGCTNPSARFIRLPYYAFVFWPLAQMPFSWAYVVWRLITLAGMLVCVWIWPFRWELGLVICAWSYALAWNFMNGQDIVLILLSVSIGAILVSRGRSFAGGLCLSLCAAKFHLFLFLPLLILQKRQWSVLRGFLLGGAVLLAASFVASGWDWPQQFLRAISDSQIDPPTPSANIHGIVSGRFGLEILLCTFVAAVVWYIGQRASFPVGLSAVLIGGCLTSRHLGPADLALLIPAVGFVVEEAKQPRWMNRVILLLLAPITSLLSAETSIVTPAITLLASQIHVFLMTVLLCGIAFEVRQGSRLSATSSSRKLMSTARAECVMAPDETKSAPLSA